MTGARTEIHEPPTLRTARLVLRPWRVADRVPFAALNADPEVMEHFPAVLSRAESDALVDRIEAGWAQDGLGLFAVEAAGDFVGFVGLARPGFSAHFTPAVEVGWRLARSAWGRGYAPEAAVAALRFGFVDCGLDEIVSFTTVANANSQRVMTKIGMTRNPGEDFDHPALPEAHPMRRHVLYRLARRDWADGA